MKNTLKLMILAFAGMILSACIKTGGADGRFVNDALPENASIYSAAVYKEAGKNFTLVWNKYYNIVPCNDIRYVSYYKGKISLGLSACKNGCKYRPRHPKAGRWEWSFPDILVNDEQKNNFTLAASENIARHCEVKFHKRESPFHSNRGFLKPRYMPFRGFKPYKIPKF